MSGFPSVSIRKFINLLVENNYTVVVIDQTTPPPNPLREVTGVYSPSTYLDNNSHDNKYLMVLYIEINASMNTSKPNISIGMCAIDSSTGELYHYETHGIGLNEEVFQETQRFYHYYRPIELIIYQIDNTKEKNDEKFSNEILDKIDILPNQIIFTYNKINPSYCKISYQNTLLKKIYTDSGLISPIEYLDLNKSIYSTISLIIGFDYIYQHNENLTVNKIHLIHLNDLINLDKIFLLYLFDM